MIAEIALAVVVGILAAGCAGLAFAWRGQVRARERESWEISRDAQEKSAEALAAIRQEHAHDLAAARREHHESLRAISDAFERRLTAKDLEVAEQRGMIAVLQEKGALWDAATAGRRWHRDGSCVYQGDEFETFKWGFDDPQCNARLVLPPGILPSEMRA